MNSKIINLCINVTTNLITQLNYIRHAFRSTLLLGVSKASLGDKTTRRFDRLHETRELTQLFHHRIKKHYKIWERNRGGRVTPQAQMFTGPHLNIYRMKDKEQNRRLWCRLFMLNPVPGSHSTTYSTSLLPGSGSIFPQCDFQFSGENNLISTPGRLLILLLCLLVTGDPIFYRNYPGKQPFLLSLCFNTIVQFYLSTRQLIIEQ